MGERLPSICPEPRLNQHRHGASDFSYWGKKESPNILIKILGLKEKNQPITKGGSSTDLNAVEGEQ